VAFTGARFDEVCQAYTSDIRQDQGIWYLDINEDHGKRLRNRDSGRKVPLHHAIVEEASSHTPCPCLRDRSFQT
jgi:hypothetical protein